MPAPQKTASTGESRSPWEDKFRRPEEHELTALYTKDHARLVAAALERIRSLEGIDGQLVWTGLPWRWSWRFDTPADDERAFCYVIPHPEAMHISVPLTIAVFDAMPSKLLTRLVRDGIAAATQVGDIRWPAWAITKDAHLQEVLALIEHKHAHTAGA